MWSIFTFFFLIKKNHSGSFRRSLLAVEKHLGNTKLNKLNSGLLSSWYYQFKKKTIGFIFWGNNTITSFPHYLSILRTLLYYHLAFCQICWFFYFGANFSEFYLLYFQAWVWEGWNKLLLSGIYSDTEGCMVPFHWGWLLLSVDSVMKHICMNTCRYK